MVIINGGYHQCGFSFRKPLSFLTSSCSVPDVPSSIVILYIFFIFYLFLKKHHMIKNTIELGTPGTKMIKTIVNSDFLPFFLFGLGQSGTLFLVSSNFYIVCYIKLFYSG